MDVLETTELSAQTKDDLAVPKSALTPPTSEDMNKKEDASDSELSDLEGEQEEEDDDWEIEPDHYWDDGKIPVFKPTMDQFRSFKKFINKVDAYGMKSGIIKVIPPAEWRDSLPDLKEAVKSIRVKNPITQEFTGQYGTYTAANVEKQRSYNLPQWKQLTEEHNHQPPAKRGERRRGETAATRARATRAQAAASNADNAADDKPKRRPGRPARNAPKATPKKESKDSDDEEGSQLDVPPTPTSPDNKPSGSVREPRAKKLKKDPDATPKKRGRQPGAKSVSSRRLNNVTEGAARVDEAAFKGFDYHLANVDEFTPERCAELEENYWKTVNFGQPMYGADMPGSLFDERTSSWNVAKLENLLDVLGTKVPGVNTAYLYLGMWKATFAWHLEDVDLYSINYIHFGAPKQWYSISQCDARRFENAMKTLWPNDAKNCSQFLRHKTYLISPSQLEKQFNIKVNKLVHYEGEFVITYPYGYHSGYNIGYNCAESVNFATESWLNFGRIAKKCECEADSVWVDVAEIERKLRGEPTPEYIEETDSEDDEDNAQDLPSPPASVAGKAKGPSRKRKRDTKGKEAPAAKKKKKKLRLRLKVPSKEPCILCPNDVPFDDLLPTDTGKQAHRSCALYTLETYITEAPNEKVCNVAAIDKARLDLKCNYCRSKKGSCFQCDSKKCTRAYHATCAYAAGVQIDTGPMPYFDEDGTEYFYEGTDMRCRFHRPKRAKNLDSEMLESNKTVRRFAKEVKPKQVVQVQFFEGDIVAGIVVENRRGEGTLLLDVLPTGDRIEVEYKYLLALDPTESLRLKPSSNAKPLPEHLTNNNVDLSEKSRPDGVPEKGDPFMDPASEHKWEEFNRCEEWDKNKFQKNVDLEKPEHLWHYIGEKSTEARAQFTEDHAKKRHNPKSNFLDTVKPPPPAPVLMHKAAPTKHRNSYTALYPAGANVNALNGAMAAQRHSYQTHQQYPNSQNQWVAPRPQNVYQQPLPFGQQSHGQYPSQPTLAPRPSPTTSQAPAYSPTSYKLPQSDNTRPASSSSAKSRPANTSISKTEAPYQFWHQALKPRSSSINDYDKNPYQYPSNSPELQRRVLPPQHKIQAKDAVPADKIIKPGSRDSYRPKGVSFDDHMTHLKKYPYLRDAYLRRRSEYVSPYAPSGGFTPAWLPMHGEIPNYEALTQQQYVSAWPQQPPSRPSSSRAPPASMAPTAPMTNQHYRSKSSQYPGQQQFRLGKAPDPMVATPPTYAPTHGYGAQRSPYAAIPSGGPSSAHDYSRPTSQQQYQSPWPQRVDPNAAYHNHRPPQAAAQPATPFSAQAAMDRHRMPLPNEGLKVHTPKPVHTPTNSGSGKGSPVPPEYSPLTDPGGTSRTVDPAAIISAETWRQLQ